jgi:hypothetical protein
MKKISWRINYLLCIVRLTSNIIETNNVTHIKACTQEKQEISFDVKTCEFRFVFWSWVLTIDDEFHFSTPKMKLPTHSWKINSPNITKPRTHFTHNWIPKQITTKY